MFNRRLTGCCVAAVIALVSGGSALAQCAPHLEPGYGQGTLSGVVNTGVMFDDHTGGGPRLFVGGTNLTVGAATNIGLTKLEDGHWSTVPLLRGSVTDMKVIDDGTGEALYVAGSLIIPPASAAVTVARWDGTAWTSYPAVLGFQALSIAWYDGSLYVGGSGGPVSSPSIRRWDGTDWALVGGGLQGPSSTAFARTMRVYDLGEGPRLYVGGQFTVAGSTPVTGIASWDGQSWSGVGNTYGSGTYRNDIFSMTLHDDGAGPALYAAGLIYLPSRNSGTCCVAVLRGGVWGSALHATEIGLGSAAASALYSIDEGSGATLYAATGPQIEGCPQVRRYRDGAWSAVGPAVTSVQTTINIGVLAFAEFKAGATRQLLALGRFTHHDEINARSVARLRGDTLSLLEDGSLGGSIFTNASADPLATDGHLHTRGPMLTDDGWVDSDFPIRSAFTGRVNLGGESTLIVSDGHDVAARDSAGWRVLAQPFPTNSFVTTIVEVDGEAVVVASQFQSGTFAFKKYAGGLWQPFAAPLPASGSAHKLAVVHTTGGDRVYVGGQLAAEGGSPRFLAEWNGVAWQSIAEVNALPNDLRGFEVGAGPELILAGNFPAIGGTVFNGVARWNGSRLASVGNGLASGGIGKVLQVFDAGDGPRLWAAGTSGLSAGFWNGAAWVYPIQFPSASITALTPVSYPNGERSLFLTGTLTTASAPAAYSIAEYRVCDPCTADFDHDGDSGTDADIEAFFRCLAGDCCVMCGTADFDNDGDTGTDADIEAFFRVLAGGAC